MVASVPDHPHSSAPSNMKWDGKGTVTGVRQPQAQVWPGRQPPGWDGYRVVPIPAETRTRQKAVGRLKGSPSAGGDSPFFSSYGDPLNMWFPSSVHWLLS